MNTIRIRIYKTLLLSFVLTFNSIAQTNPFPASQISAASYNGKSAAADYFTGRPVIALPVFSYQDNTVGYSASLNYDASGTTIEQVASMVGLGWNLNFSGYVKRNVIGAPDDFRYISGGTLHNAGFILSPTISTTLSRSELDDYYYNAIDGEADNFTFSIPGYTGKIIINKDGVVTGTVPQSNLKITFSRLYGERITSFKITTEAGMVYEFSDEETLTYKTNILGTDYSFVYTGTWFLSKVHDLNVNTISPTLGSANSIVFSYESFYSNEIIGRQYFYSKPTDPQMISGLWTLCYATGGGCCLSEGFPYNNEDIKIDGNLKRIKNISFPDGTTLNFIYSHSRCDLAYDKALERIEVINPKGLAVKKFIFTYSYMSSSGEVSYSSCSDIDLSKRLILKSIVEQGINGTSLPPYLFDYETSVILPARNSNSNDEWGYLPKSSSLPSGGANAYILKKMTYPAGSYSTYEYELNTVGWTKASSITQTINGLRVKKIASNEGLGSNSSPIEHVFSYNLPSGESSGQLEYLPIKEFPSYHDLSHIGGSCTISGSLFISVPYTNTINHSPIPNYGCGYSMVTEEIRSGTSYLGKNIYYYKNLSDYTSDPLISGIDGTLQFPFPNKQYNIPWGIGLLYKTEAYNSSGQITRKIENSYSVTSTRIVNANVRSFKIGLLYGPVNRSSSAVNGELYAFEYYYPLTGKSHLSQSTSTEYLYKNGVPQMNISTVMYEYVPNTNLVRNVSFQDSKGNLMKKVSYYPFDYSFYGNTASNPAVGRMNSDNVITPVISGETWLTKNNINYLVDASVQDYVIINNGMTKPSSNYVLKISQPLAESSVPSFNSGNIFRDASLFRQTNKIDAYNDRGNPIQTTVNGNISNSVIYDEDGLLPLAQIPHATISQCTYLGFEDLSAITYSSYSIGNAILNGSVQNTTSIMGSSIFSGQIDATLTTGTYNVEFWANATGTPTINVPTVVQGLAVMKTVGAWHLYKAIVSINSPTGIISVLSNASSIDDLRIYPFKSAMNTVVYDTYFNKIAEADLNHFINYYEYDEFQRVKIVRDVNKNILKEYDYRYQLPATGYKNLAINTVYYKNNCQAGYMGSGITVSIPANVYTSYISQGDADAQAQAAAQSYANANDACTPIIVYAKLFYENGYYGTTYGDAEIVVRFYSDAACTQPYSVQNLTINYLSIDDCSSAGPYSGAASTVANGTSVMLGGGRQTVYYYDSELLETFCTISWELINNSNYVIVY